MRTAVQGGCWHWQVRGQLRGYKNTQVHSVTMNNEKVHTGSCRPATVSLRDMRTTSVFCKELRDTGLLGEMAGAGYGGKEFSQFYNLKEYKRRSQVWILVAKRERPFSMLGFYLQLQNSLGMFLFSSSAYFLTLLAGLGKNGFSTQFRPLLLV